MEFLYNLSSAGLYVNITTLWLNVLLQLVDAHNMMLILEPINVHDGFILARCRADLNTTTVTSKNIYFVQYLQPDI